MHPPVTNGSAVEDGHDRLLLSVIHSKSRAVRAIIDRPVRGATKPLEAAS